MIEHPPTPTQPATDGPMKIEFDEIKPVALQDFAAKHNLVMSIKERDKKIMSSMGVTDDDRFYAQFKNCEVREGHCQRGSFGNGATPEAAMINYIPEIEGELLVIGAFGMRREIRVPSKLYFRTGELKAVAP